MAISRVGSGSAQTNTIAIPTHQIGDLIVVSANRNNSTPATIPSGWVTQISAGGSNVSNVIGWKLAKTTTETSGTWTNASALHVAVYRASDGILVVSSPVATSTAASATITYGTISNGLAYRSGVLDNWYFASAFQLNSANSLENAPTGMSNINVESSAGVWKSVIHDTNASQLSNWNTQTVALTTSAQFLSRVIQIFEFDGPDFGGGFRPVNIRGGADQ